MDGRIDGHVYQNLSGLDENIITRRLTLDGCIDGHVHQYISDTTPQSHDKAVRTFRYKMKKLGGIGGIIY